MGLSIVLDLQNISATTQINQYYVKYHMKNLCMASTGMYFLMSKLFINRLNIRFFFLLFYEAYSYATQHTTF